MVLLVWAETVNDLEGVRIAMANRMRALGQDHGLELTPEQARMEGIAEALAKKEHEAVLELQKAVKKHPLGPWILSTKGVGAKQAGRLLATIGNPADRPNVAKLWAYCGYGVVNGKAPRRVKGQRANWNTKARSQAYLIAESCMKQRSSPYRALYDYGREKYAGCDLPDIVKHKRALRLVAKEILKDLWVEARRIAAESPRRPDTLMPTASAASTTGESLAKPETLTTSASPVTPSTDESLAIRDAQEATASSVEPSVGESQRVDDPHVTLASPTASDDEGKAA
jgi:hypothetical protein